MANRCHIGYSSVNRLNLAKDIGKAMLPIPFETQKAVLIAGPTASGKSALGIQIAKQINGCIINTDALQVYKDWSVLTARPSADEVSVCDHHLYGHVELNQPYSVGHWLREVNTLLPMIKQRGQMPIFIGGTGLYFSALTKGLSNIPDIPDKILENSRLHEEANGLSVFANDLQQLDPNTYAAIDVQNPARTRRAWEVLMATGKGLAAWHAETPPPLIDITKTAALNLVSDTDWLNSRIDQRFDQMVELGALDECKTVMKSGWDAKLPSCQAIGAKELIAHINGDLELTDAIKLAKTQTRQYAKRQRTWFRSKMKDWQQVKNVAGDWQIDTA